MKYIVDAVNVFKHRMLKAAGSMIAMELQMLYQVQMLEGWQHNNQRGKSHPALQYTHLCFWMEVPMAPSM
jgi:hypothetical protein